MARKGRGPDAGTENSSKAPREKNIGAMIGQVRVPRSYLRRHELGGAGHDTRAFRLGGLARNPPIENHHFAKRPGHDVARLEIAMQDAAAVRERHGLADFLKDAEAFGERRGGGEVNIQTLAFQQTHRVIRPPVGESTGLMNGHDAGVLE